MLDAAEELFRRHGYGGVSVEDVTNTVGVRKPDLYNHFRDKAELYVAVRRRALDRLDASLQPLTQREQPTAADLCAAVEALLRHPSFLDALHSRDSESFLPPETRDFLFARSYSVLYRPLTTLLRQLGVMDADVSFLFTTLVALASHFGPVTPEAAIPATADRIMKILKP